VVIILACRRKDPPSRGSNPRLRPAFVVGLQVVLISGTVRIKTFYLSLSGYEDGVNRCLAMFHI
jgi:hypothetical protein